MKICRRYLESLEVETQLDYSFKKTVLLYVVVVVEKYKNSVKGIFFSANFTSAVGCTSLVVWIATCW